MADDPVDITHRMLRRLDQKMDRMALQLSDLTDNVQTMQTDISALRGTVAALRHDVNIFRDRWSDIEVRVRALEGEANLN